MFYMAYDIILICLTGDCFIYKLKFGDPFKSHEIAPYLRLPVDLYTPINVMCINCFMFQTPDVLSVRWEYVLSVDSSKQMTFFQS